MSLNFSNKMSCEDTFERVFLSFFVLPADIWVNSISSGNRSEYKCEQDSLVGGGKHRQHVLHKVMKAHVTKCTKLHTSNVFLLSRHKMAFN